MSVYFIGAGAGAADLISLRAARILLKIPVCLYAGSIIPRDSVEQWTSKSCALIDTAQMNLEQIIDCIAQADAQGQNVGRLHSGDISFYSAVAEQRTELLARGIDVQNIPGIPAFSAVAAAAGVNLTVPSQTQSVVLTRYGKSATPMPPAESLAAFAQTGATLVLHLSGNYLQEVIDIVQPYYGPDCPCIYASLVSHAQEQIIHASLSTLIDAVMGLTLPTSTLLVGKALLATLDPADASTRRSHLYSPRSETD